MSNELMVMIEKSGLNQYQQELMIEKFNEAFTIAEEWKEKASHILVTDESQVADMKMARVGRLFLREKRISIEKTRKDLKESSLREGRAIDLIARTLKELIEPIEEYLEHQEKFVEIRNAEEAARKAEEERKAAEAKAEEDRLAKEAAEREERERIRKENERLRAECDKADRLRRESEEKARKEKAEADEKIRQERLKVQRAEEAKSKAEADRKAAIERTRIVQEKKNIEIKNLNAELNEKKQEIKKLITCPKCGYQFSNI